MRKIVTMYVLLLFMAATIINPVGASKNIYKSKSSAVNFVLDLDGNDLQNAKSITGATTISTWAAGWVVNTYFGSLKGPKQIEDAFGQFGIPGAAGLTITLLKAGISAKFLSIITANAKNAKKKLTIWTVSPPFPVSWKVGITN